MGVVTGSWSQCDSDAMRAALSQARDAAQIGEVPVGAVVVQEGRIIAVGHNRSCQDQDPSAHAEVVALRAAAKAIANHRLSAATLYVTLEPCLMCVGALVQARVERVVFAAYDARAGALGSVEDLADSKALNHRFEVNGGLMADDSRALLQDFFRHRR